MRHLQIPLDQTQPMDKRMIRMMTRLLPLRILLLLIIAINLPPQPVQCIPTTLV
ncbi:uncharacterized protein LACBIDRAFT_306444 [Laccaria bicolor S238N-H82]|uniref:Predicted protein n=1 Tax=Laccaria bicolor (strain S238N-H82 / ATCC MYA-4686) TaxID=486041 RepID=B0DMY3_LACBS|nr:uncharacterized protein LACBIDRAFT_306444 [Laccaria bicolor S238N-H82]EDR04129.1 predicted protein [Laccaria bicolor S238N-H82]|eukprot:XP_001885384.1 predicted protein [Laccaria bicolor S238N-H82]